MQIRPQLSISDQSAHDRTGGEATATTAGFSFLALSTRFLVSGEVVTVVSERGERMKKFTFHRFLFLSHFCFLDTVARTKTTRTQGQDVASAWNLDVLSRPDSVVAKLSAWAFGQKERPSRRFASRNYQILRLCNQRLRRNSAVYSATSLADDLCPMDTAVYATLRLILMQPSRM